MKKDLKKIALLSSTLFLVGCGGSGGGESSTGDSNLGTQFQSQLDDIQSQLKNVIANSAQVQTELSQAEGDVLKAKQELDNVQSSVTVDAGVVEAKQNGYDKAVARVAEIKAKAIALEGEKAVLNEKIDTASAKVKSTQAVSSFGTKLLGGTLTKSDVLYTIKGVNELTNEQLLPYAKSFVTHVSGVLSSVQRVKSEVPQMLNSPMFTDFYIPLVVAATQKLAKEFLASPTAEDYKKDGVTFTKLSATEVKGTIDVKAFVKKTVHVDESESSDPVLSADERAKYAAVNSFIDDEFRKYSGEFPTKLTATLDVTNPKGFETYLLGLWPKFKSVYSKVLSDVPNQWLAEWLAESQSDLRDNMSQMLPKHMDYIKRAVANASLLLNDANMNVLSAEAPVSTSSTASYRKARTGVGGVRLNQFAFDGNTLNQSYALDMPLRLDLKGSITSGKSSDVVGSVTYNLNGTVVGMVQSYNNTVDLHAETSVLISQSVGNFFIEAQAGYVGVREGQFSGWEGQRYQATFGYDAAAVSPFVQVEYRPLSNGFSTLDATAMYVGLESDVITVELTDAKFTSSVLAKIGYESTHQAMFGQSLKPNQGGAAFIEWNGALTLSSGLELKSALTLGSKEQSVKLNVAFEQ